MGIFRFPWKISSETPEPAIGILAFEVAGLMSKLVNLWHSLSDKEFQWLRDQISDSVGVKRFVSEDEDHLMELVLEEIVESFGSLSSSVARLGKRCRDPSYHDGLDGDGDGDRSDRRSDLRCPYNRKKMERKVRKMERLVAAAAQLSHEQDVLVELEQTLRRMKVNAGVDRVKVLEFQQKVTWQRQEVKSLRAASPWVRSHGYAVQIMARSLFTVLERIKVVFGSADHRRERESFNERRNSDFLPRASSFSPAVHPYETQRQWQMYSFVPASAHAQRFRRHGGSFSGCVASETQHSAPSSVGGSMRLVPTHTKTEDGPSHEKVYEKLAMFRSKSKSLNARAGTLGHAALALHYANVIKVVERLATSPHLVGPDARDDLYAMLPGSIKSALRAKLRTVGPGPSCAYDPALAAQWNSALLRILGWLAPLAHNTLRWHSERNIESQNEFSRTNVFLVLTLYHADQAKTEAAITELLLGLNYICRISAFDDAAVVREQATSS